jgi:hypothetical protein
MRRGDDEKARLRALVDGVVWAPMGTSGSDEGSEAPAGEEADGVKTPLVQGFDGEPEPGFEPGTCRLQGGCSTS